MPNDFIVEPYSVSLISGTETVYASEREEWLSIFSVEDLLSHSDEKFHRGKSFSVSLNSGTEKSWIREGGVSRFSAENFLSHSAENFHSGAL